MQLTKLKLFNTNKEDNFPCIDSQKKINSICFIIINVLDVVVRYINLTSRFPQRSSRVNEYVLVRYNYNANYIRAELIKNRKGVTITKASEKTHKIFTKAGVSPNTCILNNETSKDLLETLEEHKIQY